MRNKNIAKKRAKRNTMIVIAVIVLVAIVLLVKRNQNCYEERLRVQEGERREQQRKEAILVTGGLGFIGSAVVEELLNATESRMIIVVDDLSSGKLANRIVHERVLSIVADIRSDTDWRLLQALKSRFIFTHIVHLAAKLSVPESMKYPERYREANVVSSQKLLRWASQLPQLQGIVVASSAAVYGDSADLPLTEGLSQPRPLSPYAENKLEMEDLLREWQEQFPVGRAVALRLFNVFGPRQDGSSDYSGVISAFMSRLVTQRDLTIYGDGSQSRDFVYVVDVARAFRIALLSGQIGGFHIFNVARGERTSILQVANSLSHLINQRFSSKIVHLPPRPGDIIDSLANISSITHSLPWTPLFSIPQALQLTFQWYQQ